MTSRRKVGYAWLVTSQFAAALPEGQKGVDNMKIGEMAALLIGGYSADDLKAIREMEKTDPDIITLAKQAGSMSGLNDLLALARPDESDQDQTVDPAAANPTRQDESDPEPDYKSMYEADHAKLLELQKINMQRDISGIDTGKDIQDVLIDIFNEV